MSKEQSITVDEPAPRWSQPNTSRSQHPEFVARFRLVDFCVATNDYQRHVVRERAGGGEILNGAQHRKEHRIGSSDLRAPQTGQNQSSGMSSNAVPGAMPPSRWRWPG